MEEYLGVLLIVWIKDGTKIFLKLKVGALI